ncbi:hypothetical protein OSJ57_26045, partial [Sphingomonas sp. HH69]
QLKTVAEKLAAFTGAPYEDWRHFTVEAGDILHRIDSLATNAAPQPAFDAAGVREACAKVAESEAGACTEDGEGDHWIALRIAAAIRGLPIPEAPASVESVEYETLIAAGFDDYAARCALRTDPDGVFCHAYFYSDGQWRFQTGGNDLTLPDGTILRCVLTKRLYARPEPDTIGWNPTHEVEDRVYPHDGDTIGSHYGNGGGLDPVEAKYLICKGGAYYRPNAQGYTRNRSEAGRYTLEEAISHSHPNGSDGPRDGITYELDTAPPSPPPGGGNLREAREVIAYSVIEGSAGIRAAEHAKDFQTGNWSDALRSADAVIAALAVLPLGKRSVAQVHADDCEAMMRPRADCTCAAPSHDQRGGSGE